MLALTRNTESETSTGYARRLSRTLVIAAGLALSTASMATAAEPVFGPPSEEEVAILRALLGVPAMPAPQPVATNDMPAPVLLQVTALAQPSATPEPAQAKSAPAAASVAASSSSSDAATTSHNTASAKMPSDLLASATVAANASSERLQLASR